MKLCASAGVLVLLLCVLDACNGVKFFLTVPKVLYYDSKTIATVSAFDVRRKASVTLEYREKTTDRILDSTILQFYSDGTKEWAVIFPWNETQKLRDDSVDLYMSSKDKEEHKTLHFSKNFGYIFIQTDKPVYTPQQTVRFRVIAVDENEKLANHMLRIDVKNHRQVIVDRKRITAEEAFKAQDFELPSETPPGQWSITASFEGADPTPGNAHTVKFEVKEYILPRFSAILSVWPGVITRSTKHIEVTGGAGYITGKPVFGKADVQFGTWDKDKGVQLFPHHYIKDLENGKFNLTIPTVALFPQSESFPEGRRLYVRMNATEGSTAENDTFEDSSAFISHSKYAVDFTASKNYFKPGFAYTLQLKVTDTEEKRSASGLGVKIKASFKIGFNYTLLEKSVDNRSDEHGKLTQEFDVSKDTEHITFTVDVDQNDVGNIHNVEKFYSPSDEYMLISLVRPVQEGTNGTVKLNYTTTANYHVSKVDIVVLVLARGHVVHTATVEKNLSGQSYVTLPSQLYAQVSPRMRIIAYYYSSGLSDFISDSLVVDTDHACLEEVGLTATGSFNIPRPKQKFSIDVYGTRNMLVGLVAVDKAVFQLSNLKTLTRASMFAELGSHDKGTESGDGKDMSEILSNSGLYNMSIDVTEIELQRFIQNHPHHTNDYYDLTVEDPETSVFSDLFMSSAIIGNEDSTVKQTLAQREPRNPTSDQPPQNSEPPQTVRQFFPESWLFEEIKLSSEDLEDNVITEVITRELPDSITTWSFLAVGLSANRGVCVSNPLDQTVQKLFYAEVRLPFKAVRLEEVKVKITVHNHHSYSLTVNGSVSGSEGLCFVNDEKKFIFTIDPHRVKEETLKVIPMHTGNLTVQANVCNHKGECDIVKKQLFVVAEGQRVMKSITFVLDPEGKHARVKPNPRSRRVKYEYMSATLNTSYEFDQKEKQQHTTIDLDLPQEVIRGSEFCRIQAFGDIMGDVINHAIVESRNLVDASLMDAEEVLGDLAPVVHALLYANSLGLTDNVLKEKGHRFVRHGVARLLKYQLDSNSFALTPDSKPATWLTAFVLRTLCHASSLAYVDKEKLIKKGFDWLAEQVNENGTLKEQDQRLANDSLEYKIMLSAEVVIAMLECESEKQESHLHLQGEMLDFLEDNLDKINEPMVLAKVIYALMLSDDAPHEYTDAALNRLHYMKKQNRHGHYYWSATSETNERKGMPYWYRGGAQASTIEATAYALLIYLKHGDTDVDPIADWLVGQRDHRGTFVGTLDSTAAIQALSKYSMHKHGVEVDLHCNVSLGRMKEHLLSFKFTEKNAIQPASLNNIPVGQMVDVKTKGQGLGQMQINVAYNIPVEKNKKCPFKIDVTTTIAQPVLDASHSNPLCPSCNVNCEKKVNTASDDKPVARLKVNINPAVKRELSKLRTRRRVSPLRGRNNCPRPVKQKQKPGQKKKLNSKKVVKEREVRSVGSSLTISRTVFCINVCLQRTKKEPSGPAEVSISLFTGYKPLAADITMIKKMPDVRAAEFDNSEDVLKVKFKEITCRKKTCIAFRVGDDGNAEQLMPGIVEVRIGKSEPTCVKEYIPPEHENLRMFCADHTDSSKGECKCFSGFCSQCRPYRDEHVNFSEIRRLVCKSDVIYQLQLGKEEQKDRWVEIDAKVTSSIKTGIDNVKNGDLIKMTTPAMCACPPRKFRDETEDIYMLSSEVSMMVDKRGQKAAKYLLDKQSTFLRVNSNKQANPSVEAVPLYFLQAALNQTADCDKL